MTIDTRLVNARLVDSSGVRERSLLIDDGRLIPEQETHDVWRTVDASGHLVIPGIVQPAQASGEAALAWAKRGTTTAVSIRSAQDASNKAAASLDWLDAVVVTSPDDMIAAYDQGARIFVPKGWTDPQIPAYDDNILIRLTADSTSIADWLASTDAMIVVGSSAADLHEHAANQRIAVEIPGPELSASDSEGTWELVASGERVMVTSGGEPDFPLLQFLYHEGHVKRGLPVERIAKIVSLNAASVYGLDRKLGFDVGKDGDLVVFDPEAEDPYLDSPWPGRVIFSLQRGNILLYNGQLHTNPGDGIRLGSAT